MIWFKEMVAHLKIETPIYLWPRGPGEVATFAPNTKGTETSQDLVKETLIFSGNARFFGRGGGGVARVVKMLARIVHGRFSV